MDIKQFVNQLNYPTRKIDGNFLLKTKVVNVESYLQEADTVFKEKDELRQGVITANRKIEEDFISYLLDELKVDQWKVFKKKKRGRGWTATTIRGDLYTHWKKAIEDLKTWVPMRTPKVVDFGTSNCQYELMYNNVTLTVRFSQPHTIQEIFDKSVSEIKRYEQGVAKENKHLVVAKEFLDKRNEDYSELITAKDIIELAEELAKEEYYQEVKDTVIDVQHSDGDDCEWLVGSSNRCECGFNRYYLEIEGNLIDGYYSYGQWC